MFFLELSCFFYDPTDVDNLISGSSAFSKTSLNIRKFTVHVLLRPGLENFEHYFTSMWDECNCAVVWAFFGIGFLWDWNENWPFPVLWHCWVFQICWHIACSTFTESFFRIWNSSTRIPSPPLALFIAMLSKAHLTSHFISQEDGKETLESHPAVADANQSLWLCSRSTPGFSCILFSTPPLHCLLSNCITSLELSVNKWPSSTSSSRLSFLQKTDRRLTGVLGLGPIISA